LIWAVIFGREEAVKLLILRGAFIDLQNRVGKTALISAVEGGFMNIVVFLCEHGANVNITMLEGATGCHMAAGQGFDMILQSLAKFGAYLNARDEEGETPLHWAVREGKKNTIFVLLQHGTFGMNIPNEDGETPLDLALELREAEIVGMLSKVSGDEAERRLASSQEGRLGLGSNIAFSPFTMSKFPISALSSGSMEIVDIV